MKKLAIVLAVITLLLPGMPLAATQQDYRRLLNDFQGHPLLANDSGNAYFPALAYVGYLGMGQCGRANIWREEIKKRSRPLYDLVTGIAYGNGDCVKFDAQKSEQHLLACLDTTASSRYSLLKLYAKTGVFTEDIARFAYGLAMNGSPTAAEYLINFYSQDRAAANLYWLCLWLRVLEELLAPVEDSFDSLLGEEHRKQQKKIADSRAAYRQEVRNWLVALSKKIPEHQFRDIQKMSKEVTANMQGNADSRISTENKKSFPDQAIQNSYSVLPGHGVSFVGMLKQSSSALPAKMQMAEGAATNKKRDAELSKLKEDIARLVKSAEGLRALR